MDAGLNLPRITKTIAAEKICFLLWLGRKDEARSLFNELGFDVVSEDLSTDKTILEKNLTHPLTARLLIAEKRTKEALLLLNKTIIRARTDKRARRQVRLLVLKSATYLMEGAEKQSARALDEALEVGAQHHIVAPFVEDLNYIRPTLEKIAKVREVYGGVDNQDYLRKITKLCALTISKAGEDLPYNEDKSELQQLSKRETVILRMVETGLSNQQLAEAMFISLATVKWHLSNIYSKLGARRRTDAVATARKVGII